MKISSKKPSKQRKQLYNYKNHQRSKLLSCRLADFLRDDYGIKRLPLRVGDQVRVCKGEFKDFEGEVLEINRNLRVKVKECVFEKADGTQFYPSIHVSNLIITKFKEEGKRMDPWRASMIEKKAAFLWGDELMAPKKTKEKQEVKK
ncbi:MAG: 50S ribosomal protein L24 [Candidatus Lokiarchaeota archaeon]|nr:50S ribosomal protein L24 [Candidatus Lokiarchaeota archaeon]